MTFISRVVLKTYISLDWRDALDARERPARAGRALQEMYWAMRELEGAFAPSGIEQTALAEQLNRTVRRGGRWRRRGDLPEPILRPTER